jgi:hypothetical protein
VPATLAVNTFADLLNPAAGLLSLREAIALAADPATHPGADTIVLPHQISGVAGTYSLSLGELLIDDPTGKLTIEATGGAATIDAQKASRVFEVSSVSEVEFQGLTITGGSNALDGGGIRNDGTVTINACTLSGNSVSGFFIRGGGIFNDGTVTINACTLSGNSADAGSAGGGLYNSRGTATITASTVSDNSASNGAGLFNFGTMTLTASTLSGNRTLGVGGGIFNAGPLTITASTLSGNSASNDFGIGAGGGIFSYGQLKITASTLSGNSADDGGGFYNGTTSLTTTIVNTIIAGNLASEGDPDVAAALDSFSSLGYNLVGIGDGATGFLAAGDQVGTAASPIDPKLGPLQDNGGPTFTRALLPGSPALNVGDPGLAGATDQRGVLRPQGAGVDIGAFENQPPTVSDFTKLGAENNPLTLAAADFTSHFHDADGNVLAAVKIVLVPSAASGSLTFNGMPLAAGQVIAAADLNGLVFVPTLNFSGPVTFQYTASDGILFATTPATITLQILSAAQQTAALQAQVDALQAAGVLNAGQANSLKVKLNLQGNNGDAGKVQSFIDQVAAYRNAGLLTQLQADELTVAAAILLRSLS